jgi:hypothetical protein
VYHLLGLPLLVRILALATNIRLGWKDLPGTNTLGYSGSLIRYEENNLYSAPGSDSIKMFCGNLYKIGITFVKIIRIKADIALNYGHLVSEPNVIKLHKV